MRGGADAELELLGGRGEASGLVGLKPSWPVRTTVKPQPGPGWPRVDLGTLKVMKREIGFAEIETVPSAFPPAST